MVRAILPGLLTASAIVLAAQAAPATQDEADRLKAVFERYVGHPAPGEPGSVSVTPDGTSYTASLDIKRALKALDAYQVTLDDAVMILHLTPQDNGVWRVTSDSLPPLVIHTAKQIMTLRYSDYKFAGAFDPKLAAFTDGTTSTGPSTIDQQTDSVTQHQRIEQTSGVQTAVPADAGSASMKASYTITGLTDEMVVTPPPPAPSDAPADAAPPSAPVNISYKMPSAVIDVSLDRLHMKDLLDIWAFFVAHPDHDSIVAAQEDLRGILRSALPFLGGLAEKGTLDEFALTTPVGPFSARRMAVDFELADLPGSGTAAAGLTLDGLNVPTAQLPPWSVGLIPSFVDMKAALSGFHFGDAARQAVDEFDLKADGLTPEQRQAISQVAWPATGGKVLLSPSRLTSTLLDLRLDGEATITAGLPSGRLSVTGTGLDKVITMLQGAAGTDPSAAQALTQVVAAKNLAKPGPDGSLSWVLVAGPDGAVTVNDIPMK